MVVLAYKAINQTLAGFPVTRSQQPLSQSESQDSYKKLKQSCNRELTAVDMLPSTDQEFLQPT